MASHPTPHTVLLRAPSPLFPITAQPMADMVLKVGVGEQVEVRTAHKLVLARLSTMLEQVLREQEEEDEICLLLPELSSSALDLILA